MLTKDVLYGELPAGIQRLVEHLMMITLKMLLPARADGCTWTEAEKPARGYFTSRLSLLNG